MSNVDNAIQKWKGDATTFPVFWIDDATDASPTDYLIKLILDRASVGLVYGPSGSGKTFFVIDLAGHIAAGIPWRGHRVKQGTVVYIAAEAGTSALRRFSAWRNHILAESHEDRVPLAIVTRGANLLDPGEVDSLIQQITPDRPALVVIDTLSRSIAGGDENSSQDMTQAIGCADRIRDELGSSVLFVHHSGKDQAKGARGHSALFAAADTVIAVNDYTATVEKSRDGESGAAYGFKLRVIELGEDSDGDPVTTCVVEPTEATTTAKAKPLPGAAQAALTALREVIMDHGQTMTETSTTPAGVQAVNIDRWRNQFRVRYGSDDVKGDTMKKAFQRSRELLIQRKLIAISDPFVWLTK